jgi:diamine N-acetyltransferase
MTVTLCEITKDNWRHCIALDPGEASKAFIPSNLYALAESKFSPSFVPLGDLCGECDGRLCHVQYPSRG